MCVRGGGGIIDYILDTWRSIRTNISFAFYNFIYQICKIFKIIAMRVIIKRYFLFAALAVMLSLFLSCNKEESPVEAENQAVITFSPVIDGTLTKGTMIEGPEFVDTTFKATCWTDDTSSGTYTKQFDYTKVKKFTHAGGSGHVYWGTVDESNSDALLEKYWKGIGTAKTKVNKKFYAYANLPSKTAAAKTAATVTNSSSTSQTLAYNVTKVLHDSLQTDILLGYYSGSGVKPTHGTDDTDYVGWAAPIKFRHPLSAIKFERGSIEGWAAATDKINSITVSGVHGSGTCTWTGNGSDGLSFSWGSFSGTASVSMSESGTAFLIPQAFAAGAITVSVSMTLGGSPVSASATLSAGQWEAGKYYTYTLNYTPGEDKLELTVSLADWGEIKKEADMEDGSVLGFDNPDLADWGNGTSGNINYTD